MVMFNEAAQRLHEWGRMRVLGTFQKMGCFTGLNDRRTREGWFDQLNAQPGFKQLFEALVAMLVSGNVLEENEEGITLRVSILPDAKTESSLLAELRDYEKRPQPFLRFWNWSGYVARIILHYSPENRA